MSDEAGGDGANEAEVLPRYLRTNPRQLPCAAELVSLSPSLAPVPWLPEGFYSMDRAVSLQSTEAYQGGRVHGMDASSAVPVLALGLRKGDHALDMCCAPGGKMLLAADLLWKLGGGEVTGVDASAARLSTARSLLRRSGADNCRLVLADATRWRPGPDSGEGQWWEGGVPLCAANPRKFRRQLAKLLASDTLPVTGVHLVEPESGALRSAHKYSKRCSGLSAEAPTSTPAPVGFSAVLVDAECTSEGHVRHLREGQKRRRDDTEEAAEQLVELQRALLSNGYKLLRPGGTLVYSTCSFQERQNEGVVRHLLETEPEAVLADPLHPHVCNHDTQHSTESLVRTQWSEGPRPPCQPGSLPHTLYFTPKHSSTSGLFVAKLQKRQQSRP
eukprot:NODE_665_length_1529_cov_65.807432_g545_i0.p1 GENE.NODE_665_length_1529_cov_65.807432_g545_i0~~NODE_665_length_1529_cov_65.807432_g545_i0.p1  ORF type:complete len:387 (-),score=86.86 NODE_665_length_1529_cov_65.807432_g545_i0:219-1379(-)